jgi:hypothetical protein
MGSYLSLVCGRRHVQTFARTTYIIFSCFSLLLPEKSWNSTKLSNYSALGPVASDNWLRSALYLLEKLFLDFITEIQNTAICQKNCVLYEGNLVFCELGGPCQTGPSRAAGSEEDLSMPLARVNTYYRMTASLNYL